MVAKNEQLETVMRHVGDGHLGQAIGGLENYLLAYSHPQEMEQLMRIAAETINKKIAAYDARFPERSLADKLSFVALNETVSRLATQRKMEALADEAARLKKDTDDYLSQL